MKVTCSRARRDARITTSMMAMSLLGLAISGIVHAGTQAEGQQAQTGDAQSGTVLVESPDGAGDGSLQEAEAVHSGDEAELAAPDAAELDAIGAQAAAEEPEAFGGAGNDASSGSGWNFNFDTSLQYTIGARVRERDDKLGNHPFFAEGNYKFDKGDIVTNRLQGIVEFQGVYNGNMGFRISGSAWKDFAYSDRVKTNPNPAFETFLSYPSGRYSGTTKKYHIEGGELLDAFVFYNTDLGNVPVYIKLGRFTQYWGNAFLFGFSNIAYGQHPVDYIKAFSQPGSEVKELFLPRTQAMVTAEITPELSISAQYFFEFRWNRFPEGGTYLGPFDIMYAGPQSGGALAGQFGGPVSAGTIYEPDDINGNFGLKVTWSPQWAGGDLSFYYRELDETQPWPLADIHATGGGDVHMSFAENVKLYGLAFEKTFGTISTGFEVSYRDGTALSSALTNGIPGVPTTQGASGNVINGIANAFVQLGSTPLWDTGILIAEATYSRLTSVTGHPELYNGVGYASCPSNNKWDGCATKSAWALGFVFEPQWLQVFPGVDLSMPTSATLGIKGNPAYAAGSFYAQGTQIYSIGIKALFKQRSSIALQYNGYNWRTSPSAEIPGLGESYGGFGGNGPVALNDKDWIQLTFKTSF